MATSRSGAGGKIVTNRRKQRLVATPYDRPPPQPSPPPPPKSPNWITGIIVPSARALASGAGKILSFFNDSESSSSEDEESASEDDIDNDNHYESPDNGVNMLNESHLTKWRGETKRLIEQLIMQEIFSREECDRLTNVLNSRVMDWSVEAGAKSSVVGSPEKTVDHEDADIYYRAVQEAKKWFQNKKVDSSSLTTLAPETCNHVETEGGSPVDVARFYMKERPPWASPGRNVELRTPWTSTMKLFKEGTLYSVGHDSLSTSKKRSSLTSGSWNIQEELRRVRSKAAEDMLHTPPTKVNTSLFAVEPTRVDSVGAGGVVFAMGERMIEPGSLRKTKPIDALVDAGVISDPALSALESRQHGEASEAQSSKPAVSTSGNNEVSEAVRADGDGAASKFPQPSSINHAEKHHTDSVLSKINGPPATELAELGAKQSVNGPSSSQPSLSAGMIIGQHHEQHDEENHRADIADEKKPANSINVEGNCELLSEAYMEVPIVTETDSIANSSQNSLGLQYEELSIDVAQPSPKEMVDIVAGKQQGRKSGKNNRRGRGRGRGRGK